MCIDGEGLLFAGLCLPCPTSPSWVYPLSDAWTSCETCEPWSESWTPWQSPISFLGTDCGHEGLLFAGLCLPCPTSPSWVYPLSDAWTSCETCEPWSESWTPWQSPISFLGTDCGTGPPGSFPGHPVVQAPYQMRRKCHLWGSLHRPSDAFSAAGSKEIPLSGIFHSHKQSRSAHTQYGSCTICHCSHCMSKMGKMTTFSLSCHLCLTLVPGQVLQTVLVV